MNEKAVLSYNLFDGGFGSGEKELSNSIVITRKKYKDACHICHGDIQKGEKSRVLTEVLDGHIGSYRICNICCEAISVWDEDCASVLLDDRYELGYTRRKNHG